MEEQIENERQRVHGGIEDKFFNQTGLGDSITIQPRQYMSSVFGSTKSFEKLRDEILNHPNKTLGQGGNQRNVGTVAG